MEYLLLPFSRNKIDYNHETTLDRVGVPVINAIKTITRMEEKTQFSGGRS